MNYMNTGMRFFYRLLFTFMQHRNVQKTRCRLKTDSEPLPSGVLCCSQWYTNSLQHAGDTR